MSTTAKEILIRYGDSSSSSSSSIKLHVDMSVGLGGDKWPAADLFISLVTDVRWKEFFKDLFADKLVIELGSGTGLAGILVDQEFSPKHVYVSDIGDHIKHMEYNIKLNNLNRCSAIELDWFNNNSNSIKYDIIIALECVYKTELFEVFIQTMDALSDDNTVIFLGLTRNFQNGKSTFWDILRSYNFHYMMIPQQSLPVEYHNEMTYRDCSVFILSKKKLTLL